MLWWAVSSWFVVVLLIDTCYSSVNFLVWEVDLKRIYARVTDETEKKLLLWSDKLGVTKTQLINMSILAGLDSIIRAVDPVSSLTPEQVVALVQKGIEFQDMKSAKEGV